MYTNLSCIVKGVIGVLFGLLAIVLPEITLTTFDALFWVFIAAGIALFLLLAITSRSDESLFWFGLSAVLVIIGALSFFSQGIVTLVFLLIVAGVAFYSGFSDINYALEFPKTKYYIIVGMFLISVLLLGVMFKYFPITDLEKIVLRILGTFALIFGIFSVTIGFHEPSVPAEIPVVKGVSADPPMYKSSDPSCELPKEK